MVATEPNTDAGGEAVAVVNETDESETPATAVVESPVVSAPADATPEEEVAEPRGFLSRLFGKSMDY